MPKIDVSYSDLCDLARVKVTEEDMLFAKCEIDEHSGDVMKLDMKDTNRPDLWSAEGVAREIRLRYKKDFPSYKTKKSGLRVIVDKSVKDVRPYTVCAVVKGLKINGTVLSQLIQLQEKIAGTFGRNRKEAAIGIYDLGKIKSPIKYTTTSPMGIKFIPLDFEKEMTPAEILEKHQKGKEFGHLLRKAKAYPMFIDDAGNVLSIPPIINSAHTGRVDEKTRDIFIECSGHDMKFLMPALNSIVAALHERGGRIETVDVMYGQKKIVTPDMTEKKFSVDMGCINKTTGLNLGKREMTELLLKSGYLLKISGNKINLLYPAYRQDIMHARDVAEDVVISYGYNSVEPDMKREPTTGKQSDMEIFSDRVANIFVGAGFQEILSYTLANRKDLLDRMDIEKENLVEIENPMSANWSVFRSWLIPSVIDFLSKNKHVEYPQKIFEIGDCVNIDEKQETATRTTRKISAAVSNSLVSYEDLASVLDALLRALGIEYELKPNERTFFIKGRSAAILSDEKEIGFIGEIHPHILNNWNLEKPVVAFEIDIEEMQRLYLNALKRRR